MRRILTIILSIAVVGVPRAQESYFPPATGEWETTSVESLGWCTNKVGGLYTFLEQTKTNAFIVLKDGKLVIERYFGDYDVNSINAWESCEMSMVAMLAGIAVEDDLIDINKSSTEYLGIRWSSLTQEQERNIKVINHLTMTTGLEDNIAVDNCLNPACLIFKAAPGERWAYHSAPYQLIIRMIQNAKGDMNINEYTRAFLSDKIGMTSTSQWFNFEFISTARDMARFGLLVLNEGDWDGERILDSDGYYEHMAASSQELNPSYGFLWWLNGQSSYKLPGTQRDVNTSLVPNAPDDMLAALGRNDQKIYIVPSEGIVAVRLGDAAGSSELAISGYDLAIWEKISELINGGECLTVGLDDDEVGETPLLARNPVQNTLSVSLGQNGTQMLRVLSNTGTPVLEWPVATGAENANIPVEALPAGVYIIEAIAPNGIRRAKFLKQ